MSKVLQTVSSFGDYERLSQGVFENFPKLKLKDSTMNSIKLYVDVILTICFCCLAFCFCNSSEPGIAVSPCWI
ncbi:hypothetical protein JTB14_000687 [Gonioctena quinquepunctata]|nr:hypothetical protein JTB14_000687 [Gonioctena quinquepunctata]